MDSTPQNSSASRPASAELGALPNFAAVFDPGLRAWQRFGDHWSDGRVRLATEELAARGPFVVAARPAQQEAADFVMPTRPGAGMVATWSLGRWAGQETEMRLYSDGYWRNTHTGAADTPERVLNMFTGFRVIEQADRLPDPLLEALEEQVVMLRRAHRMSASDPNDESRQTTYGEAAETIALLLNRLDDLEAGVVSAVVRTHGAQEQP